MSQLDYRLAWEGLTLTLYHYRCGRLTYSANDVYWRRCGTCYREQLLREHPALVSVPALPSAGGPP